MNIMMKDLFCKQCSLQFENRNVYKDNSILLLMFYTVVTQQKFDSKSVTQLSSAQCHRLYY